MPPNTVAKMAKSRVESRKDANVAKGNAVRAAHVATVNANAAIALGNSPRARIATVARSLAGSP